MKNIKASLLLMATALVIFFHQQGQAQTVLRQSVFGNGSAASSDGTYRLSGTAGQPVIGITSNSSQVNKIGFWYTAFRTDAPGNGLPIVANPIPDQTLTVGASFTRDLNAPPVVFVDPNGNALIYTASSSDPGKATVAVSGSMLTFTAVAVGNATITVTANDGKSGVTPTTFLVTVQPAGGGNRPPVVANAIPNQTLTVGSAGFVRNLNAAPVVFNDPDGDVLSYTATSNDPSKATATVSGSTLTVAPVAAGSATITVTANDNRGGMAQTTFLVTVNRPPVVATAIPIQSLTVGSAAFVRDLNAAPVVFTDPDGDVLSYSATSNDLSKATATVSGSTLTIAAVALGSATITVTADDGKGGTASTTFTATVTPVNRPPVVANAILNQTLTVGGASFIRDLNVAPAVFNDPDGDVLSYSATSSDPSKATATISGSTLTVATVAAGSATIMVTANDGKGGTVQTPFVATINPRPAYTVIVTPNSVGAGGQVLVSWTAPPGSSPKDWIGLYRFGAANNGHMWWRYTDGATQGSFSKELPTDPGQYEFRYMLNDGFVEAARSNVVTVTGPAHTITVTPSSIAPGGQLTVRWTAPSGSSAKDWIGLYPVGAPNNGYKWWAYMNGVTKGSFPKEAPMQPGQYEFRYMLNDGFVEAARSNIVTVTAGLSKADTDSIFKNALQGNIQAIPSSFELSQNYPNPFNPETTIQYGIPAQANPGERAHVTLRIFDLQGQLVRTLVDGQKSPGQYRVIWDGKNDAGAKISSGVYLYTVNAGDFKATKRMTMLK